MAENENGEYYDKRQRTYSEQGFCDNLVEHHDRIHDGGNQSRQPVVDVDRAQKEPRLTGVRGTAARAVIGNAKEPGKELSLATDGTAEPERSPEEFEKTVHSGIVEGGPIRASGERL